MSTSWRPKFAQDAVTVRERKSVYSGFSTVEAMRLEVPLFQGGHTPLIDRELIRRPEAIAALLVDTDQNSVVLVEQFRVGAIQEHSPWLLEIVAGMIEQGDTPEHTAYREIEEETGCRVLALQPVMSYLTTPGILNEKIHVFCAKVNAPVSGSVHGLEEEGEDIRVHVLSFSQAFELLEKGQIVSSPAIVALQWLKLHENQAIFE